MPASIRFISAGAGSGKTYALTEILHRELAEGRVAPGGVLATTFTKRAATELRERVRGHLIERGAYALANAMGSARIGTINSVCGGLLQRFAFEAGLSTEQRVLDEARAAQLLREAIDTVIEGPELRELLHVSHRLSLLEGVRSGDEAPWRKALKMLVDQARSNGIEGTVLRQFGASNADNLLTHFPPITGQDVDALLRNAIHEILPTVRNVAESVGKKNTGAYLKQLEATLKSLDEGALTWAAWNKLGSMEPEKGLLNDIQPVIEATGKMASHPKLHVDIRRYLEIMFSLAADSLDAYAKAKRQLGALDFTDQERQLLDVIDAPAVAATLADELDLLMVDEFQDTSPIQLALFLKLAACARQVVWVGDIKQAIYGFRGSDTALMRAVVDALPGLGGTRDALAYSWRSRPSLVAFVNDVFGAAFDGLPADEVTLQAKRPEIAGTAAVADWILAGKNKGEYQKALANGVARLIAEGTQVVDRETKQSRDLRLSDIAVLARANDTVTDIAAVLNSVGIASATRQPGLLDQPEIVLALACLRRLEDDRDTLATAEILSLADCQEPEVWLTSRLAWIAGDAAPHVWKEGLGVDDPGHPILQMLTELRSQATTLAPREAVELVIARCGLAARVVQWQQDSGRARRRIANLDRFVELAGQYEDECLSGRDVATLSGLLLWLQDLSASEKDDLAQPAVDAVQVMTHHAAKGLEWPVVVLCDLAGDVKDRLWNIQPQSLDGFDVDRPLHRRFLRYWPWPFGAQKNVAVGDLVAASPTAQAMHAEAVEEHKRLLYVSMTRARDMLVLARPQKDFVGPWMETVSLSKWLSGTGAPQGLTLSNGESVPFARWSLEAATAHVLPEESEQDLTWFEHPETLTPRLPLTVSPSSLEGYVANIIETVPIGARINTDDVERSILGEAIHACIAADLACEGQPLVVEEVQQILARMGVEAAVDSASLQRQLVAIRRWLTTRWPGVQPIVELPISRCLANGQRVSGRTDLLLRTATGWVLLDHKSTPQGHAQWADVAASHAGQLAAYCEVLEAASGIPVEETWLVLPVAGAALRIDLMRQVKSIAHPGQSDLP